MDAAPPVDVHTTHDAGVEAGGRDADAAPNALHPGEYCPGGTPILKFDPPEVVVARGKTRPVRVIVEPDLCYPLSVTFQSSNAAEVPSPAAGSLDLRHASYDFTVSGTGVGNATLTASLPSADGGPVVTATLDVVVNDGSLPTCALGDGVTGALSQSSSVLTGSGGLGLAALSVPPGAFARTDELAIAPFSGTIACTGDDLTVARSGGAGVGGHVAAPGGLVAIGPAVTFTASAPIDMTQSLRRELDFSVPVNPAAIPTNGRMRHLQVLYMSAGGKGPTTSPVAMTIANPQITQALNGAYALRFSSPWFGTYQAAFAPDAGAVVHTRHLTHRAILGFSMGAAGAASFGFRHHDLFDFIAPLGGPSDWTWMFWYIETFNLGGFCPRSDPAYPNCPSYAPNAYPLHETYAHTVDYDHWFYQDGNGNGGHFSRSTYAQLFGDLALAHGNPYGQNFDPNVPGVDSSLSFFPAGPKASDPWVLGNPAGVAGGTCAVTVNPLSPDPNPADPPSAAQQTWVSQCIAARCDPANAWVAKTGYFDREYNPTGSIPVISYCEGAPQILSASPYENVWAAPAPGTGFPMDATLAVDLNGNGVRDANEPILRHGHEPWSDTGVDGLADKDEPGYDPVSNPDPDQDDYDFQRNPGGTEGDHRYQVGEPFLDYGLDGVSGTTQLRDGGYDFGEGDGVFTTTTGLTAFYADDAHSILRQWSTAIPGGAVTDAELLRLTVWADGGVRDLFNFGAVGNHFIGSVASRTYAQGSGGPAGASLRRTVFYNGFDNIPGQTSGNEAAFDINLTRWADVPDAVSLRYGTVDATAQMIADGDGQHVGTSFQLLNRLQTSIYGAIRLWPDADRTLVYANINEIPADADASVDAGLGSNCNGGLCNFPFEAADRVGPVYVQLPPGYAVPENLQQRYPVIFALHGYGQTPDGLTAAAIVGTAYMDDPARSEATRLGKTIIVYVDGHCRFTADTSPQPECINGSFYLNSDRPDPAAPGQKVAQFDAWFDALVGFIDQNFRTMGPSDVQVTD